MGSGVGRRKEKGEEPRRGGRKGGRIKKMGVGEGVKWVNEEKERKVNGGTGREGKEEKEEEEEEEEERRRRKESTRGTGLVDGRDK